MGLVADLRLARKAKANGADFALRIIREARGAGIPVSLAFALVDQESNFRNVFGHDPGGLFPGQPVTRARVIALVRHLRAGGTSNGVGVTQLTYPGFIAEAEQMGGAHKPANQLRVAFRTLAGLVKQYGETDGIRRYNGAGPAATRYSLQVRQRQQRWHNTLK